jgi:hypothetical protein
MTIEDGLQALLTMASPLPIPAVGNRVYRYKAPQGSSTSPQAYIVIFEVSLDPLHSHHGPPETLSRRLQLSVWSRSQSEGVSVRDALRRLLDGYVGPAGDVQISCCLLMAGRYGFDDVTGQHHFSQDFQIYYTE